MAKKDIKKTAKVKIKKKSWHKIISPKIFGNKEIGESYLQSTSSAIGRRLKVNLKDLTYNIKDQNVYIALQVDKAEGSNLKTIIVGYELSSSYVKRAVRKNTARLDDYFTFKTKGGREVIVKTLMITLCRAQRSVQSALKRELKLILEEEISKVDFSTFISNLVSRKVLNEAKRRLKKIFPLKEVAVRSLYLKDKSLTEEEIIVEDRTEKEVNKAVEKQEESFDEETTDEETTEKENSDSEEKEE
ncbi:hypothetical protein COY27_01205 [Candidatus Woesearchaeota archaeon CG_4_10_14_0_2_um_filter_33_13]|nr:MAG: hypothetical protein COY27_01205 [Candidatus Woesearchaeota archaeon CG_4_10_14_0_2_um_filter_33_13]